MASYTVEQHVQMLKMYYQNECSLVQTLRALRPFYGRRGGPSKSTLQRLVAKFESTGSINNLPTPVRAKTARSAENIAAIRDSVQENPRQSIHRRSQELGLSQTSTWRILRQDLGLHPLSSTTPTMSKTALVILAEGAEEIETVATVDVLRRAGVKVTLAGLEGSSPVLCSRQVTLVPDKSLADALAESPQYDAVILPGGLEGTERLCKSTAVGTVLKEHEKAGKIVAAICAAPTAFASHGVAAGKRVTSYPSFKDKIAAAPGAYQYVEGERVVVDGNIVTSRGPGTALHFGVKLAELLVGKEKANQVEKGMILVGY